MSLLTHSSMFMFHCFIVTSSAVPWVPEVFLACGVNFRCWPKADTSSAVGRSHAGHYKDLTETGNRARKVSGTQGTSAVVQNRMWGVSTPEIAGGERRGSLGRDVPPRRKMSFISLPCSRQETNKRPHSVTLIHVALHTELSNFLK